MTHLADQGRGFILKAFRVSVDGYGAATYYASARGKAIADAWRSDAFSNRSFKDFLRIVRCSSDGASFPARFGDPITIEGSPAFFVESNRQYVRFVRAGSDVVLNAHPLDVLPIEYRPETYRSEKFDAL